MLTNGAEYNPKATRPPEETFRSTNTLKYIWGGGTSTVSTCTLFAVIKYLK